MKKLLCAGVISLFIIGCSNPKSTQIPSDPDKWSELKPQIEKLSEEEQQLLAQFLMRKSMGKIVGGNGIETGTTIGDAIQEQKKWLDEKKAQEQAETELKAKIEAEKKAKLAEINKIITVALIKKEGSSSFGSSIDNIDIELAFQNKGNKDISAIKGITHFNDVFGDNIKSINLSYDDGVKANSTATYNGSIHYNQFMDEDKKLLNTDLNKLKFIFEPQIILFSDGTKLDITNKD
ncbi:hypothetical protein [Acinetobacter soli]|uniref:Lipoprotein n=1 Tax=Acinetobacter soli TaxID=487316 RepID=A0AB38YSV2_9GAMM|nr:hypothetical protein [Acinetobacter soli]WND04496.1 hypothetical protein RHP80_09665 [Acinetobacter soli]